MRFDWRGGYNREDRHNDRESFMKITLCPARNRYGRETIKPPLKAQNAMGHIGVYSPVLKLERRLMEGSAHAFEHDKGMVPDLD